MTWFILTPDALAEGGSMERVIRSPARAIRMMRQPAGLVAWFGRSGHMAREVLKYE